MELRLITFDLDDTLWDVQQVLQHAEKGFMTWLAANHPNLYAYRRSIDSRKLLIEVLEKSPQLVHDVTEVRRLVLTKTFLDAGLSSSEASKIASDGLEVFLKGRHEVTYFDGVLPVLEQLHSTYMLGVISNGNADIKRLGLDRYFSFSISAAKVGESKPSQIVFMQALIKSGVGPSECLHIGDHPDEDVAGAKAVGMNTIQVRFTERQTNFEVDESCIRKWQDIPKAVSYIDAGLRKRPTPEDTSSFFTH